MSKILFVCSANQNRSRYAEHLFSQDSFTSHHQYFSAWTIYGQVEKAQENRDNERNSVYARPKNLLLDVLAAVDVVFVMELKHKRIMQEYLNQYFEERLPRSCFDANHSPMSLPLLSKVNVLWILDNYDIANAHHCEQLHQLLQSKLFLMLSANTVDL